MINKVYSYLSLQLCYPKSFLSLSSYISFNVSSAYIFIFSFTY
nr:MAG TPA: hypothetical protein [Caudoviricetes sp.]